MHDLRKKESCPDEQHNRVNQGAAQSFAFVTGTRHRLNELIRARCVVALGEVHFCLSPREIQSTGRREKVTMIKNEACLSAGADNRT